MKCSRCGKELYDFDLIIKLTSSITLLKISNGQLSPVDNLAEPTSETLCLECFDKYADCLNQLNRYYSDTKGCCCENIHPEVSEVPKETELPHREFKYNPELPKVEDCCSCEDNGSKDFTGTFDSPELLINEKEIPFNPVDLVEIETNVKYDNLF